MTLKSDSARTSGNKTEFEGIITSSRIDSHYERIGIDALKSMAKKANRGVKVLTEHNSQGQPIGRSLSAEYDPKTEQVTSRFYIQKGLNLRSGFNSGGYADSDSYIAAAQEGTTDGLSIGALVKKETCDFCGTAMKRMSFFGMTFVSCENRHYPGQKIYKDEKGNRTTEITKNPTDERVTATIDEAELMEFSMVAFGANPDAEITEELQKAFEEGQLDEMHLAQLNDRYAIKVHGDQLIGGIPPMLTGGKTMSTDVKDPQDATTTDKTADATPEPATTTPEPAPAFHDKSLSKELQADLAAAQVEIGALETENERLKVYEERSVELESELRAKDAEIERLTAAQGDTVKIQKYELLCERAVDWSVRQFNRSKSTALRPGEEDAERARLTRMNDYEQIMEWGNLYRNRAIERDNRKTPVKVTPESILAQDDIVPELYV